MELLKESSDFQRFLQDELESRCEKNARYSLRAFAKSLGIYHATLSALISGKRPVTKRTMRKLAEPLALSPAQVDRFLTNTRRDRFKEFELDTFISISKWHYDAILELTHTRGFRSDPKWIATRLGIAASEVSIAIERLTRLGLLAIDSKGTYIDLSRDNTTIVSDDVSHSAHRRYQKEILELSRDSVESVSKANRDHTSITVAIKHDDLPQVKVLIKSFRRRLSAFLQRAEARPDEVYQLSVSFFPLTRVPD